MSGSQHHSDFDDEYDDYEGAGGEVGPVYAVGASAPLGYAPLIAESDRPAGTAQIRVQFDNAGRPTELGYVAANATWDDVIGKWHSIAPHGGTFRFLPVNQAGKVLVRDAIVMDISPAHAAYQKIAEATRLAPVGGAAPVPLAGLDNNALHLIIEQQKAEASERRAREEREAARREAERKEMLEDRRRLKESEERLAKERIALAAEAAQASNTSVRTILETAAQREETIVSTITSIQSEANTTMMGFMTAMLAQQQQTAADALARREKDAELERERFKRDMDEREKRAAAQRKADREDALARAAAEKAEFERSMERERAFHERSLTLASTGKGDDLTKMAAKAVGIAKTLGIDLQGMKLSDLLGMVGGKGPASMMEMGIGVVDKIVDGVVEVQKLQMAEVEQAPEAPPGPSGDQQVDTGLVDVTFPDGTVQRMTRAQYERIAAAAQQNPQQIPQQPGVQMGAPQQNPGMQQGVPGGIPGAAQQGFTPPGAGFNPAAQGFTPPQQSQPQPPAPQPPQQPAGPPPVKNPVSHMPAAAQKKARKEAKEMANVILKHKGEKDDDVFGLAVMAEIGMQDESPELDAYCKAIGVDAALKAAGLEDVSLRNRILNLLAKAQSGGHFPAEIPLRK